MVAKVTALEVVARRIASPCPLSAIAQFMPLWLPMDREVQAVFSGAPEWVKRWREAAPGRVLRGSNFAGPCTENRIQTLRRLHEQDAGLGDRLMYGSDAGVWPGAIRGPHTGGFQHPPAPSEWVMTAQGAAGPETTDRVQQWRARLLT